MGPVGDFLDKKIPHFSTKNAMKKPALEGKPLLWERSISDAGLQL